MDVWFAPSPSMPPAPGLASVISDWRPSKNLSTAPFIGAVICGLMCLGLVAVGAFSWVVPPLGMGLLLALAWVQARRSYAAVGEDWLYVRTRLFSNGGWTFFSSLESGKMMGQSGSILLLRGPSFRGRLPASDWLVRHPTPFHGEVARRVLAQRPKLSSQAGFVLHAWAGKVTADARDD